MGPIDSPETSVTTNLCCVKSQKSEDLTCKCIWLHKNSTAVPAPTNLRDNITHTKATFHTGNRFYSPNETLILVKNYVKSKLVIRRGFRTFLKNLCGALGLRRAQRDAGIRCSVQSSVGWKSYTRYNNLKSRVQEVQLQ